MKVVDAANNRRSCRGFKKDLVDKALLEEIFTISQRAPSWCNIQPWHITVITAPDTQKLSKSIIAAAHHSQSKPDIPFPGPYPEPYQSRRRACGIELYQAMGIEKGDQEGRTRAWLRNYQLFDAPHLAIITRDQSLGEYATLDIGVWLGYFLLIAESLGVSTIPMASMAEYPGPIREFLGIDANQTILLGLAMGYPDKEILANKTTTSREAIDSNVDFALRATD